MRFLRHGWLPALLLLSGCGGPSGADIRSALQDASNELLGERIAPTIEDVTDVDCRAAQGKPGFVCSFKSTSVDKMMHERSSQVGEARFVQDNSRWVVMADK